MQVLATAPPKGANGLADRLPLSGSFPLGNVPKKISLSRSHQLLELACKLSRASLGGVGLLSAEGQLVEHIPFGVPEDIAKEMRRSTWLSDLMQFILGQPGRVCLASLADRHPRLGTPANFPVLGPFVGLPLRCPGRYKGALYLARTPGQTNFTELELDAVEPILTWLEQGSVFEEAHLLAQLRLLNRVAQAAAGNLNLDFLLERSLRELDRYLPLDVSAVWLVDEPAAGTLSLAATSSIPSTRADAFGLVSGLRLPVEQTSFGRCLQGGQGLYIDLGDHQRPGPAGAGGWADGLGPLDGQLATRGATCFFAAPLRAGDRGVGVLQCVSTRSAGFTGEQIQLLYLVADLLGPAISNCRLFDRLRTTYEELRSAQDQLIHVEKMRALGELASGMAHDFNNSLCGVLGFLELALMDKSLAPAGRNYLESARTCALDAAHTVRRVQDFARCRRTDPILQPLDVNDLLRQTVELTRHKWESLTRARGHPITVVVQAEASTLVAGNAAELREVLTNLVFNAVDAMPTGGTLTLRSWNTRTDVFLSVADSGVGMPLAVRQRIFEPFFTTKGERGTGLGLSVTFGIIQGHQGDIKVVSEEGQGTTLTIRLTVLNKARDTEIRPQADREAPHPEVQKTNDLDSGPRLPVPLPKHLRILVVEDEQSIRDFLERVLNHLGHRPRVTADATQALAAFTAERFDLVMTDLGLPGVSGEELAKTIRSRAPHVPVVLLTGWADQLHAEGKPLAGVSRILGKPLTISALTEALAAISPQV